MLAFPPALSVEFMEAVTDYVKNRLRVAIKLTHRWFFLPRKNSKKKIAHNFHRSQNGDAGNGQTLWSNIWKALMGQMSSSSFEHHSLRRHLELIKHKTPLGNIWESILIFLSAVSCSSYVAQTYDNPYHLVKFYWTIELVVTQCFAIDLMWNTIVAHSISSHLKNVWTWIDLATTIPVYVSWITGDSSFHVNLSVFRFIRVLRIARVLRFFRFIQNMSGITRQIIKISLTLASLLFVGAGFFQMIENDINAYFQSGCFFINAHTNWQPSCFRDAPVGEHCRCEEFHCRPYYGFRDKEGMPSQVYCDTFTFYDTLFFSVYTGDLMFSSFLNRLNCFLIRSVCNWLHGCQRPIPFDRSCCNCLHSHLHHLDSNANQ